MKELNAVGDVILKEPRAMRALADGSRLALHDALRRTGPATTSDLASLLGSQPRQIREHLEALEEVGLVERRETGVENEQTTWAAVGKGVFFEGETTFRWLPGGFFLEQCVQIDFMGLQIDSLELIGYDPETETFPSTVYSNSRPTHCRTSGMSRATNVTIAVSYGPLDATFTGSWREDGTFSGGWRPNRGADETVNVPYDIGGHRLE